MTFGILSGSFALGNLVVSVKEVEEAWGRAPRGVEQLRLCAWDEDATTLAIDAAQRLDLRDITQVFVSGDVDLATFTQTFELGNATVHRLANANDALAWAARTHSRALVVVAHVPTAAPGTDAQWAMGAGAIAFLVGPGGHALDLSVAPSKRASTTGALGDMDRLLSAATASGVQLLDASLAPRSVSPTRALQESRLLAAGEAIPDVPMGAFVPWGTWMEDIDARLRLVAKRCAGCERMMFPPRGACPHCMGRSFVDVPLPHDAVVYASTHIGRGGAPSEYALEQAQVGAFWVAVIDWPAEGVRLTARLTSTGARGAPIGTPVRGVVRRLFEQQGVVRYGVKFAPQ